MKTQTVSDVVEEKNIPLAEILDIFEGYGYGKEEMQDFLDSDMTDLSDAFPELKKLLHGKKRKGNEVVNDKSLDAIKDNFTPPGAKDEVDMTIYKEDEDRFGKDALSGLTGPRESEQLKEDIDTNDNGKIEEDEMADFQKSLDDYAAKNKKGREDIPARYRK